MKKFLILLAIMFSTNIAYSSPYTPTIGKIEDVIFGFQYSNEADDIRLSRIEEKIYGNSSKGSVQSRMQKLKNDLSADLIGQEITPVEDTFQEEIEDDVILGDPNIQYPAVDELENQVFKQSFPKKDIKQRLSALEEKTFGKSYNDDLASRVDRLKAEIKPQSFMRNNIAQSSNSFFDDNEVIPLEKDYYLDRYDPNEFDYDAYNAMHNPVKKANINSVERKILKQTYQNDSMENRLSRLENAMFGTEFPDDSQDSRLNRISSAYNALKTSAKYDSNKFSQNMATAFQIGTLILMVLACIL